MATIPPVKVVFPEHEIQRVAGEVAEVLRSGMVAGGKHVARFEVEFANLVGTRQAVAVNSGGAALETVMRALGVDGREVIVPTNTFIATSNAVLMAGGNVRLSDIDPETISPSLDQIMAQRTDKTVGVIMVHMGGVISPEIEEIRRWCDHNGLWLVEDCAHAHGSARYGKAAGSFGIAGCYSFFATKTMTCGEGGMVVTDNDELAQKIRVLRDYGKPQPWVSVHEEFGANWRMSEFSAIVGLSQLRCLDSFLAWRSRVNDWYEGFLTGRVPLGCDAAGTEIRFPFVANERIENDANSWYKEVIAFPGGVNRERVKDFMLREGVKLSGAIYEVPLHRQPIYQRMKDRVVNVTDSFPEADLFCGNHICLPIYFGMTEDEVKQVVKALYLSMLELLLNP